MYIYTCVYTYVHYTATRIDWAYRTPVFCDAAKLEVSPGQSSTGRSGHGSSAERTEVEHPPSMAG